MVKITFLDKVDNTHRYIVDGANASTMNTIRRKLGYCLSIYAVDEIDFYENDSVIVDEMLANRIALCPLTTPEHTTGKKVTLSLDKIGPCNVYSGDLKSNDEDIKCVYETILLTKLKENQKLRLDAYAFQGEGREHVKFSPAIVSYSQLSDVEVLKGCDGCKACVDACPTKCLKMQANKPTMDDFTKCTNCRACIDACPKSCLNFTDTNKYILTIELIGQTNISTLLKLLERYNKEYFALLKKKIK